MARDDGGHEFAARLRYHGIMPDCIATIHRRADAFQLLRDEWNALLQRSHANRIFSTWEWNERWWQAYAPGELAIVSVRDERGQLLGLAPWFTEAQNGRRLLATIGCDEVSDYLDIIIAQGEEERVFSALTDLLRAGDLAADSLYFCNLPADSPVRTCWPAELQSAGLCARVEQQEICPRIALPASWEEYLAGLNKKQRHELRRKIRRMGGAGAEVQWRTVRDAAALADELPRFFTLMAESDPAKAAFLAEPANQEFFRAISLAAAENGWLRLCFLSLAGEDCAAYFNFHYGDELLIYNSGLSAGRYANLSPGIVLLAYIIQEAIAEGIRVLDFLRGDETYKFRMGGIGAPIYQLKAELPARHPGAPASG